MGDAKGPKYLNSSDTPVFKKSRNLFALNFAKASKREGLILCEGYMDVIAMHQAGFDNAVATLGTALTSEQSRLIAQYAQGVTLSYDSDGAGQAATRRAVGLLGEVGVKIKVLSITGAKDPDEYIKKFGAEAFAHLIESSGGAIDYELGKQSAGLDLNKEEDRAAYLKKAVVFLATIHNPLERAVYVSKAAETARIPAETVRFAVESEITRQRKKSAREEQRELINPRNVDRINPESAKLPREEKAERGLICFAFHNQDKLEYIRRKLTGGFATEFNRRVFEFMEQKHNAGQVLTGGLFNEAFTTQEVGRIYGILNDFAQFAHSEDVMNDYITVLNEYHENINNKDPGSMSVDELLEFAQKQKEKKNK